MRRRMYTLIVGIIVSVPPLQGQTPDSTRTTSPDAEPQALETIVVSATRTPTRLLDLASPASVFTSRDLSRRPSGSVISLFDAVPGLDMTGVGPNQLRPVIRGFGGQRILLLEDGLRVNNARRQQDFGELPALIQQQALERVEVLRGPASVLYGSDAIGGVVNFVGAALPSWRGGDVVHGTLRFRYVGGEASTTQPSGSLAARRGRLAVRLDADHREADPYRAPAGRFGTLRLDEPVRVLGTGLRDRNLRGELGVDLAGSQRVFLRHSDYLADDAGFGYVDPSLIGPNAALVDIRYPEQRVNRTTVGYRGEGLHLPVADRLDVSIYRSSNRRELAQSIFVPFGPGTPPGAGIAIETRNATDVGSLGARVEAGRRLDKRQLLTWGVELARDRASGSDSSVTKILGFGPAPAEISTRPALPRAEFRSLGFFAQDAVVLTGRLTAIAGLRYQANTAETFTTPGLQDPPVTSTDRTTVWAANLLYRLSDGARLVAASSRGFRSPNLVERFYNGVTPEGNGFQARNRELRAETSVEFDLGIRIQRPTWSFDGFVFQNNLRDGIRVAATGDTVMGFPEFSNINIDRLRVRGVELTASWLPLAGMTVLGGYSGLDRQDVDQPLEPVGEGAGRKVVAGLRYHVPSGRLWGAVRLRHQGGRASGLAGASLVGGTLPAFTVVDLDLGGMPFLFGSTAHVVTATIENVGNILYAETANAAFFRPAPGRRLQVMWRTEF